MMQEFFDLLHSQLNPEISPLTEAEQKLLYQQTIDENQPGTILHDFQALLDFLQTKNIEVSGVNNLFPLKVVSEINSRLSHPMEIQLKRPVQKSYPYIHGLYLLLRCSGLSQIKSQGKKQFLVLDEATLQSWSDLNLTERYFNLLEAWILWANNEILGERYDALGNLYRCMTFWSRIPEQGLKYAKYQNQDGINYYPGLHNIALLDLFGFLSLQHGKSEPGKGWRIASVKRTTFGDVMLRLLVLLVTKKQLEQELEDNLNINFGTLQPNFQTFFPQWEHNLQVSKQGFTDGIYIFKVSLSRIWRRIAIPAKLTLSALAGMILDAFDFDYDHLYEFSYKDRFGRTLRISHPYMDTLPCANEVQIGDVSLEVGGRMTYLYDFGDNWKFDVQLEEINSPDSKLKKPKILEVHGEAPPQYWTEDDEWDEEEEE